MKLALPTLAACLLIAGCNATPKQVDPPASDPLTGANTLTGKAEVYTGEIEVLAGTMPDPPQAAVLRYTGHIKAILVKLAAELQNVTDDMRLIDGSRRKAEAERDTERAIHAAVVADYEDDWVGPRAKRWATLLIGVYAGLGVLSVALGVLSPFGWGMTISKLINTVLPIMPWATWIRDLVLLRGRGIVANAVVAK